MTIKQPAPVASPYISVDTTPTRLASQPQAGGGVSTVAVTPNVAVTANTAANAEGNVSYYATGVEEIAGLANYGRVFAGANVYVTLEQQTFTTYNQVYTGNGTVGGSNGQIQFNNAGSFDGSANLTFDGANVTVAGIKTNHYYYANGTPVTFGGTPGGSNTQIQFNNAGNFAGSSAFTFNHASNVLAVIGNITAGNVLTSNLTTTHNINANTGTFYGDQYSDGALYVGSPAGTVLGSDVVMQVTANAGGYSQTNFQNINSGPMASSDYILTADNGNDVTHFLDMGMTSSGWNGSETNVLANLVPNNGYLYVQDGNLTLGTRAGNVSHSWNFDTSGILSTLGNINAGYFLGNGSQLTGITASANTVGSFGSDLGIGPNYAGNDPAVLFGEDDVLIRTGGTASTGGQNYGELYLAGSEDAYFGQADNLVDSNYPTFNTSVFANATALTLTVPGPHTMIMASDGTFTYDGSNILCGGSANTGNITFDNINIIGDGNIHLQPNPANSDSYLDVYLTGGPDVHIAATSGERTILGRDDTANVTIDTNGSVTIQAYNGSGITWTFDNTGGLNLPDVAQLNSGGIGVTNSAEFGTQVGRYGNGQISGSEIYMSAGHGESRYIVDSTGNSLGYFGIENTIVPAFAGAVAQDPGINSDYTISIGNNNAVRLAFTGGNSVSNDYTVGLGVLNATGNINGIIANTTVTVIGSGDQGWSFGSDGNLTVPGTVQGSISTSLSVSGGQPGVAGSWSIANSHWVTVAASANWALGADYTIEYFSNATTATGPSDALTVMSQEPDTNLDIYYLDGNLYTNNNTAYCAEPTPGVLTHVAIVSTAGVISIYYNGVAQSLATSAGHSLSDAGAIYIGRRGNHNFQYFQGSLTNIRITNKPVYTGNFSAPTSILTATQSSGANIEAITGTEAQLVLNMATEVTAYDDTSTWTNAVTNHGTVFEPDSTALATPPGSVQVTAGNYDWAFDNTGNLTIPGVVTSVNNIDLYAYDAVTINSNNSGTTNTWQFDETGTLTLPQYFVGPGPSEQLKIVGTRKIVGTDGNSSAQLSGSVPNLVYTCTSNSVLSAKLTFVVQSYNTTFGWEQFDVAVILLLDGNVGVTVSNRMNFNPANGDTQVTADVNGDNIIEIYLAQPGSGTAYVNYVATEFNVMAGG